MITTLDRSWARSIATVSIGLTAALVLPFIVHLFPADGGPPMGARLLPIFFASLVLVLRGAPLPALAVALLAPLLNRLLTGMPAGAMLPTLLIELLVFTLLLVLATRLLPLSLARVLGPLAYLAAAMVARPLVFAGAQPLETLSAAFTVAWPGLLMLLAVGALAGAGDGGVRERRPRPS